MVNPRSRQRSAVIFKHFIIVTILVDLIFFIVSTEPQYEDSVFFYYVEGITSSIFFVEYLVRLLTVVESKRYKPYGSVMGRLRYIVSTSAIIDAVATFPFFLELATGLNLPTLTYVRVLRLLRITKTGAFATASEAVWRVLYYNREILYVALLVCIFLVLVTSVLLYYFRPPDDDNFQSIGSTMYISTLMLTGQGGPDADKVPWYTKSVILLTGIFSIGMFAIPASMLTWGFEAEAERLAIETRKRAKGDYKCEHSETSEWEGTDSDDHRDEEYQKIIAGEDDEDKDASSAILKIFRDADIDGSGSLTSSEFLTQFKKNQMQWPSGTEGLAAAAATPDVNRRMVSLEKEVSSLHAKVDKIIQLLQK